MDKKRILKEAQKIAKDFSFWMVSGNIAHLYGYPYETPEKKYEMEIEFTEDFPVKPPHFIYHNDINELLGNFQLETLQNWTYESKVVYILHELKSKIKEALQKPQAIELEETVQKGEVEETNPETEEYITPDLNAYPPDFQIDNISPSFSDSDFFYDTQSTQQSEEDLELEPDIQSQEEIIEDFEESSVLINTELSLIQQEYAYDQLGTKRAVINVYLTITLTKTFIIKIDFTIFPEKPKITFSNEIQKLLGDTDKSLDVLKNWDPNKPKHVVEIIRELEKKLYFIKEIEAQSKKIIGEYQCDTITGSTTQLNIHLLTYGFKKYTMEIDLETYPEPPIINLSHELKELIRIPITELNAYKNWEKNEQESIEIVREISWLVDKNSRINFEIDLLKEHYQNIKYNPLTEIITMDMKGKMKTEDLTFQFQIRLPKEYPMKLPDVKVLNEFELEAHEKIKNDLHTSFKDFFNEWTPFSYLIDLFNLISKKIFEVSVVSCVICHKIECPTCGIKIAASQENEPCYTACPHCERAYHKHCWEQTIRSFGKCGFCLRQP